MFKAYILRNVPLMTARQIRLSAEGGCRRGKKEVERGWEEGMQGHLHDEMADPRGRTLAGMYVATDREIRGTCFLLLRHGLQRHPQLLFDFTAGDELLVESHQDPSGPVAGGGFADTCH